MTRRALFASCFALALASCADDGGENVTPDAAQPDASTATVVIVDPCPGTVAAEVTTSGDAYAPMATTISQGEVVKFEMPLAHDVAPTGTMTDPGLRVGFNQTRCLRFTTTGTFNFQCTSHSFVGSVTVN